jgi:hypothetical protein
MTLFCLVSKNKIIRRVQVRVLLLLAFTFLTSSFLLHAQVAAGLTGRINDSSSAAISNAQVTLTQTATNLHQQTLSSSTGDYQFHNLIPGIYKLEVEAAGFKHLVREGVQVVTGTTVTADLALIPGGDRETVTVSADASQLQVATSNIQPSILGPLIVAMPLNTRNFIQLAMQSPGVSLPPGTLLPRINGGRPRTNEYLYDGISALQPEPGQVAFFPILDDIQEFTVEANNVPAEFGRFNTFWLQRLSRQHLRVSAQRRPERTQLLCFDRPQAGVPTQPLRIDGWRSYRQGPPVLLRRLSRCAAIHWRYAHLHGSDQQRAERHLQWRFEDLRPCERCFGCAFRVSQRHHRPEL